MKIVFFGIPETGLTCLRALIRSGSDIAAVVPPLPTHPGHRRILDLAGQNKIPCIRFSASLCDPAVLKSIKKLRADLGVVCAWDHLLPEELLAATRLGFINCHPSLLPDYRGGNPYFHVIANGEQKTGVTVHKMNGRYDSGDIIAQKQIAIQADETFGTLLKKLNDLAAEMIVRTVDHIERTGVVQGYTQALSEMNKKAPIVNPQKGHTTIDWSSDSTAVERFVRAYNPFYGAVTYFRNSIIKVWSGRILHEETRQPPGTLIPVSRKMIGVATGKGVFLPAALTVGHYLTTDVQDFVKRVNPRQGEMFSADRPII